MNQKRDWPALIREQAESTISITDFCAEHGIHRNTFYRQRKRYGTGSMVEIPVLDYTSRRSNTEPIVLKAGAFSLTLSAGFDEALLKRILQVLKEVG